MNPLTMNENELKQYIDSIFLKYDRERNGTLNTNQMTSYLSQLFQLLGYGNVNISPEQAQQAIQMIDRNNDNKITKMELFLTFKELANSQLTDFGDVKIFTLGQGGSGNNQQQVYQQRTGENKNLGNQGGNGNNYSYQNSNNWVGTQQGGNGGQNTLGNFNPNNIPKPTINTSNGWSNNGNINNFNTTGNNSQGYANSSNGQIPPAINQNLKGSQAAQWGPQIPSQYPPQSLTWGQQQGRGSGAQILPQQSQQQFYQQARGSGVQLQNQAYSQQARGSGVGIEAQYGFGFQPVTQNTPLSTNLVWGNGSNQQLVWNVPGQRPGTPPSAAYTGYQTVPVYYDPYSGGYYKVGKGNEQDDKKETVVTQN